MVAKWYNFGITREERTNMATYCKDDTGKVEEFTSVLEAIKHYSRKGYIIVDETNGKVTMALPAKEIHPIWGDAPVNKVAIRTA